MRLEHVAQDGSKVLANASKHKAMSYERMGQTEERLGQEITTLLTQAQQQDSAEDARYGMDHTACAPAGVSVSGPKVVRAGKDPQMVEGTVAAAEGLCPADGLHRVPPGGLHRYWYRAA